MIFHNDKKNPSCRMGFFLGPMNDYFVNRTILSCVWSKKNGRLSDMSDAVYRPSEDTAIDVLPFTSINCIPNAEATRPMSVTLTGFVTHSTKANPDLRKEFASLCDEVRMMTGISRDEG